MTMFSPPDWRKWAFVTEPDIREVILLSLNLDPDNKLFKGAIQERDYSAWVNLIICELELIFGVDDFFMIEVPLIKNFEILTDLARREFGYKCIWGDNINIFQFSEWVTPILKKMGLVLPEEFPIKKIQKEQQAELKLKTMKKIGIAKPKPTKGKPETLKAWIKHIITEEKGLSLSDEMPLGLQAELIKKASEYGYTDNTAVKRAWAAMKLKSVKN